MVIRTYSELTSMQQRILTFLAQSDAWQSRQDMYEFVGRTKGYSAALGAPTGADNPNSLEALGLVERQGKTRFKYRLSSNGRSTVARSAKAITGKSILPAGSIDVETATLSNAELEITIDRKKLYFSSAVSVGESIAAQRARKGQTVLRRMAIRNYGQCCAVCDVSELSLLRASHIARWADLEQARGELANVLCLCVFHDVLFEHGYWMLSDELRPMNGLKCTSTTVRSMLPSVLAFKRPTRHPPAVQYVKLHRARHSIA